MTLTALPHPHPPPPEQLFQELEGLLSKLHHTAPSAIAQKLVLLTSLEELTISVVQHFTTHLAKEETSAMPLIQKVFTVPEMKRLVGDIMGKRPATLMHQILEMMLRNLDEEDTSVMLSNMKLAVAGTYFERWLADGGFRWEAISRDLQPSGSGGGGGSGGASPGGGQQ